MRRTRRSLEAENARLRLLVAALTDEIAASDEAEVPADLLAALRRQSPGPATVETDCGPVIVVTSPACDSPVAVWHAVRQSAALPACCEGAVACVHHMGFPPGLRALVKRRGGGEVAVHVSGWLPAHVRRDAAGMALRHAQSAGWRDLPAPAPRRGRARWVLLPVRLTAGAVLAAAIVVGSAARAGRVQAAERQLPVSPLSVHPAEGAWSLPFLPVLRGARFDPHRHAALENVPEHAPSTQEHDDTSHASNDGG